MWHMGDCWGLCSHLRAQRDPVHWGVRRLERSTHGGFAARASRRRDRWGNCARTPQTQRHPVHGVHGTAERSTAGEPKHGGAVRRAGLGVVVRRGQLEALHEQVAGHGAGSQGDGGHGDCWEMCARTCRHSAIRCTGVRVRVGRSSCGGAGAQYDRQA